MHPQNGENATSKVVIRTRELRSSLEPGGRGRGAAGLDVDEGELAERGDRGRDISHALRNQGRLVKEDRALLVAAAQLVDEGRAKSEQASSALTVVPRECDGTSQRLDASVDGAHINGCLSGFEQRSGCCGGCLHALENGTVIDGGPDGSRDLHPECLPEEALASSRLFVSPGSVAMTSKTPDEELLERLIERVANNGAAGEPDRDAGFAGSQVLHCRVAQMGLNAGLHAASLDLKPLVKLWARWERPPAQKLTSGLGHSNRVRGSCERVDINNCAGLEQCKRITAKQVVPVHASAHFRQRPTEGPQRVDRVLEEQIHQLAPPKRPIAKQYPGNDSPALAAPRPRRRLPLEDEARRTEESDL